MSYGLRFLGVGDARAGLELGNASAVLERDGEPILMIDCGPFAIERYLEHYRVPPPAVYVSHTHLDHVGGFERLFTRVHFDPTRAFRPRIFVHAAVLPLLHARVAEYPDVLAEGGVNFWQAFELLPCTRGFWLDGAWFDLFATRHHAPGTSYGVRLRGALVYTSDTRPIPEVLRTVADAGEMIVHDCALEGNPSHTGADDLEREYPREMRQRMVLIHYGSAADGAALAARGHAIARVGARLVLPIPAATRSGGA